MTLSATSESVVTPWLAASGVGPKTGIPKGLLLDFVLSRELDYLAGRRAEFHVIGLPLQNLHVVEAPRPRRPRIVQ
jgi:hypothetical protein